MLYIIPAWATIYEIVLREDGKLETFVYDNRNWGNKELIAIYNSFTEFENHRLPSIGYYLSPNGRQEAKA